MRLILGSKLSFDESPLVDLAQDAEDHFVVLELYLGRARKNVLVDPCLKWR